MAAVSPAFKEAIRVYLAERADNEPEFAVTLAKAQKNLDDCLTYILNKSSSKLKYKFTCFCHLYLLFLKHREHSAINQIIAK